MSNDCFFLRLKKVKNSIVLIRKFDTYFVFFFSISIEIESILLIIKLDVVYLNHNCSEAIGGDASGLLLRFNQN